MTTDWIIEPGDHVTVSWETINVLQGVVRYKPQAEGDSWVIEDHNGVPHYIQRFSVMRRTSRAADER